MSVQLTGKAVPPPKKWTIWGWGCAHVCLQNKFVHLKEPATDDVMRLASDLESTQRQMKDMSSSLTVLAISKAKLKEHMLTSNKAIARKDLQKKYFRCANANHKTKECLRKNLTCYANGKQGHIALVCLSKGNQRQQGQQHQRRNYKKGSASAPASRSASPNLMCDTTAAQIYSIPSCNILFYFTLNCISRSRGRDPDETGYTKQKGWRSLINT